MKAGWRKNRLRAAPPRKIWGCWSKGARKPLVTWAASQTSRANNVGERILPFHSALVRAHPQCCIHLWVLSIGRTWTCWSKANRGPQRWLEGWCTPPARRGKLEPHVSWFKINNSKKVLYIYHMEVFIFCNCKFLQHYNLSTM